MRSGGLAGIMGMLAAAFGTPRHAPRVFVPVLSYEEMQARAVRVPRQRSAAERLERKVARKARMKRKKARGWL